MSYSGSYIPVVRYSTYVSATVLTNKLFYASLNSCIGKKYFEDLAHADRVLNSQHCESGPIRADFSKRPDPTKYPNTSGLDILKITKFS